MILDGIMAVISCYFAEFGSFEAQLTSNWLKLDSHCLQT